MPAFLINLLILVLILVILQWVLEAVGLEARARQIVWIVAIVIGVIWLLTGQTLLR